MGSFRHISSQLLEGPFLVVELFKEVNFILVIRAKWSMNCLETRFCYLPIWEVFLENLMFDMLSLVV